MPITVTLKTGSLTQPVGQLNQYFRAQATQLPVFTKDPVTLKYDLQHAGYAKGPYNAQTGTAQLVVPRNDECLLAVPWTFTAPDGTAYQGRLPDNPPNNTIDFSELALTYGFVLVSNGAPNGLPQPLVLDATPVYLGGVTIDQPPSSGHPVAVTTRSLGMPSTSSVTGVPTLDPAGHVLLSQIAGVGAANFAPAGPRTLLAGPGTGNTAQTPSFRALISDDLPLPSGASDLGGANYTNAQVLHLGNVTDQSLQTVGIHDGAITAAKLAVANPSSSQLSGITTSNLSATAGLVGGQIASVNPSSLTGTGTVPLPALANITASQLASAAGIVDAQISNLAATKLIAGTNGQVVATNNAGATVWADLPRVSLALKYGVAGDAIFLNNAAISANSPVLTSTTGTWTSADVGKAVMVNGAGPSGGVLITTIFGCNSATSVTLAAAASTTVAAANTWYGTDNTAAILAWLNDYRNTGSEGILPQGVVLTTGCINIPNDQNASPSNPVAGVKPKAASYTLRGSTASPTSGTTSAGTILLLLYQGAGGAITGLGDGRFKVRDLTVQDDVLNSSTPFFYFTNGWFDIECNAIGPRNTILGSPNATYQNAIYLGQNWHKDVVQAGSTNRKAGTAYDGTLNSNFLGYGSRLRVPSMVRCRRMISGGHIANTIRVADNFTVFGCGNTDLPGGACVDLGDKNGQWQIENVVVEMAAYNYAVRIGGGAGTNIAHNVNPQDLQLTFTIQKEIPPPALLTADSSGNAISTTSYVPTGTWLTLPNDPYVSLAQAVLPGQASVALASNGGGQLVSGALLITEEMDIYNRAYAGVREMWTVSGAPTANGNGTYTASLASTASTRNSHAAGTRIRIVRPTVTTKAWQSDTQVIVSDVTQIDVGGLVSFFDLVSGNFAQTEYSQVTGITGTGPYTLSLLHPLQFDHAVGSFVAGHELRQTTSQPTATAILQLAASVQQGQAKNTTAIILGSIYKDAAGTIPIAVGDTLCLDSTASTYYTSPQFNTAVPAAASPLTGVTEWFTVQAVDVPSRTARLDRPLLGSHLITSTNIYVGPFSGQSITLGRVHNAGARLAPSSLRADKYIPSVQNLAYWTWFTGGGVGGDDFQVWSYAGQQTTTTTSPLTRGVTSIPVADRTGITASGWLRIADTSQPNAGYGTAQEMVQVTSGYVAATGPGSVPIQAATLYAYASGVQIMVGPFDHQVTPLAQYQARATIGTGHRTLFIEPNCTQNDVRLANGGTGYTYRLMDPNNTIHFSSPTGRHQLNQPLLASGGLVIPVSSGKPSDYDWLNQTEIMPPDGRIVEDNLGGTAWVRSGGAYRPLASVGNANVSMSGDPLSFPGNAALTVTPGFGQARALQLTPASGQTYELLQAAGTLANAGIDYDGMQYGLAYRGSWYTARLAASGTPYASTVMADTPLIWYTLGDPRGSSTVADSSGNNKSGTVNGTPTFEIRGVTHDQQTGISTPGFTSPLTNMVSPTTGLVANAPFSVEFIFSPSNYSYNNGTGVNAQYLIDNSTATSEAFQIFWYAPVSGNATAGRLHVNASTAAANDLISNSTILPGSITHVLYTWDGTTESLYINGALDISRSTPPYNPTFHRAAYIGSRPNGISAGFPSPSNSQFWQFAVYSSALSSARAAAHYAGMSVASPQALFLGRMTGGTSDMFNVATDVGAVRIDRFGTITGATITLGYNSLPAAAYGEFTPADYGLFAFSTPPNSAGTGAMSVTSGSPYAVRIPVRVAATCNKIWYDFTSNATGVVGGQNQFGLYTSAGVALWRSARYTVTTGATAMVNGASLTQQSTSGSGTGFTATAVVSGGTLTGLTTTNAGSGYVNGEVVTLTDGGGNTCTITFSVPNNYILLDTLLVGPPAGLGASLSTGGVSLPAGYVYLIMLQNATSVSQMRATVSTYYTTSFGLTTATAAALSLGPAGQTSLASSYNFGTNGSVQGSIPLIGLQT